MILSALFATCLLILAQTGLSSMETPGEELESHAEWDGHLVAMVLQRLAREELGFRKADELFRNTIYKTRLIDWAKIKYELAGYLGSRAESLKMAVRQQKEALEQEEGSSEVIPRMQCCNVSNIIKVNTSNETRIHTETSLEEAICVTAPPHVNTSSWSAQSFLRVARTSLHPGLLRQYVGTEEGVHMIYPPQKTGDCHPQDPRTSVWYAHTYSPVGKDIVILIDDTVQDIYHAVNSIFKSLTRDDKTALIMLQNPEKNFHGCKKDMDTLMPATRSNTDNLTSLLLHHISDTALGGQQFYMESLKKAFKIMEHVNNETQEFRNKVIIVLSNVTSTTNEASTEITSLIRKEISNHPVGIIILTYGFGEEIDPDVKHLLAVMANGSSLINTDHSLMRGSYTHVRSTDNITSTVGAYFTNIGHVTLEQDLSKASFMVRHVKELGHVLTFCSPIYKPSGMFGGATCGDVDLTDYLHNITYFSHGTGAYSFLIDSSGATLSHPLLHTYGDITEKFHDISLFEQGEGISNIISSMKRGHTGRQNLHVSQRRSFLGLAGDWVGTTKVVAHYSWTKVPHTDFSFCIVSTVQDIDLDMENVSMENINYLHPSKVKYQQDLCRSHGTLVTFDSSTVSLGPKAFYKKTLNVNSNEGEPKEFSNFFKEGINTNSMPLTMKARHEVSVSGKLDAIWKATTSMNFTVLWRYYMGKHGVLRMFPGVTANTNFNPAWYTEAISRPGILTLTNGGGLAWDGSTLILSQVIHDNSEEPTHPSEGTAVGVLAGEIRSDLNTKSYIFDMSPDCKHGRKRCLLINKSGYIVLHQNRNILFPSINNHLIATEPDIAQYLISKGALVRYACWNIKQFTASYNWKLNLRKQREDFDETEVEIVSVPGTNVYLLKSNVILRLHNNNKCHPCKPRKFEVECHDTGGPSCECPCHISLDPFCPSQQSALRSLDLCPVQISLERFTSTEPYRGNYSRCFIVRYVQALPVLSGPVNSNKTIMVAIYIGLAVLFSIICYLSVHCLFRNKHQMIRKIRKLENKGDGSEWVISWENTEYHHHITHLYESREAAFDTHYDVYLDKKTKHPPIAPESGHMTGREDDKEGSLSGESGQDLIGDNWAEGVEHVNVDPTGEGTSHGGKYRSS